MQWVGRRLVERCLVLSALVAAAVLAACGGSDGPTEGSPRRRPPWLPRAARSGEPGDGAADVEHGARSPPPPGTFLSAPGDQRRGGHRAAADLHRRGRDRDAGGPRRVRCLRGRHVCRSPQLDRRRQRVAAACRCSGSRAAPAPGSCWPRRARWTQGAHRYARTAGFRAARAAERNLIKRCSKEHRRR